MRSNLAVVTHAQDKALLSAQTYHLGMAEASEVPSDRTVSRFFKKNSNQPPQHKVSSLADRGRASVSYCRSIKAAVLIFPLYAIKGLAEKAF